MKTAKRLISTVVCLVVVNVASVVQAQFNYETNNGTITITRYTGPGGNVIIPGMINGVPVTSVARLAFEGCVSLTNVTLPWSISVNRVVLWDTWTREAIGEPLRGHLQGVYAVAFSPDGRRLASGGLYPQDAVKVWNVETGAELVTLPAPPGCVQLLAFSPDGNTLAGFSTVGPESWLYLWHAPSLEDIAAAERNQAAHALPSPE